MRAQRDFRQLLELDPFRVQKTIEEGNWETSWNSVPENLRGNKKIVIAAIQAGVIERFEEIPRELWTGGANADEDVVAAAIRKGLLEHLLNQNPAVGSFDWSSKVLAAAIDAGSWRGRFTDIPATFREVPTASGEVVAAAIRVQDNVATAQLERGTDVPDLPGGTDNRIVRTPAEVPVELLDSSPEVLAAAIRRWWSARDGRSFLEIPGRFREGETASGAVIGAAIEKKLIGAPRSLADLQQLNLPRHVHEDDEITLVGLSRNWFPTWRALPEAAKGSVRVLKKLVDDWLREDSILYKVVARTPENSHQGPPVRWGTLVKMPAKSDVRVLQRALVMCPGLFRTWNDVPHTGRRNLQCVRAAVDHAPHLLTRWADVPRPFRNDRQVVRTIVNRVRVAQELLESAADTRPYVWWMEDGPQHRRPDLFRDLVLFRDVPFSARSARDLELITEAIENFGRSLLDAWADASGMMAATSRRQGQEASGVVVNVSRQDYDVAERLRDMAKDDILEMLQLLDTDDADLDGHLRAAKTQLVDAVEALPEYLLPRTDGENRERTGMQLELENAVRRVRELRPGVLDE